MTRSLSNLVNNLAEVIHKIKCNKEFDDKKCKTRGIKCKDCDDFLEYTDDLIGYKCLSCSKN